jgi:hypothetical protein
MLRARAEEALRCELTARGVRPVAGTYLTPCLVDAIVRAAFHRVAAVLTHEPCVAGTSGWLRFDHGPGTAPRWYPPPSFCLDVPELLERHPGADEASADAETAARLAQRRDTTRRAMGLLDGMCRGPTGTGAFDALLVRGAMEYFHARVAAPRSSLLTRGLATCPSYKLGRSFSADEGRPFAHAAAEATMPPPGCATEEFTDATFRFGHAGPALVGPVFELAMDDAAAILLPDAAAAREAALPPPIDANPHSAANADDDTAPSTNAAAAAGRRLEYGVSYRALFEVVAKGVIDVTLPQG